MTYCNWKQGGDECSETWDTDCGNRFCLNDGDPFDNGMKYCPYCGQVLSVTPLIYTEDLGTVYGDTQFYTTEES